MDTTKGSNEPFVGWKDLEIIHKTKRFLSWRVSRTQKKSKVSFWWSKSSINASSNFIKKNLMPNYLNAQSP